MSTYESRSGLRLEIKELSGKGIYEADNLEAEEIEIVKYIKKLGFEPNTDSPTCTKFKEMVDGNDKYKVSTDYQGNWVIDLLYSDDWDTSDLNLHKTMVELNASTLFFANKFNQPSENVTLFAYNWYNGCDGPDLLLK